jgi:hypothetical protein
LHEPKSDDENEKRLLHIVERITICALSTPFGGTLRWLTPPTYADTPQRQSQWTFQVWLAGPPGNVRWASVFLKKPLLGNRLVVAKLDHVDDPIAANG